MRCPTGFRKTPSTALALAGVLLIGGAAFADMHAARAAGERAEAARTSRLAIEDVVGLVEARGYTNVLEIELEGGRYKIKASDAAERQIELVIDATSGELVSGPSTAEVEALAQDLAAAGYPEILKLEVDGGRYEVQARDDAGREVELKLDIETREIVALEREESDDSDERDADDDSDRDDSDDD